LELFATTIQGIEDIAAEEVEHLTGCGAQPDVSKVLGRGHDWEKPPQARVQGL